MDFCWQSHVTAFKYAVWVGHSFSSKEQVSLNFMAAVTICSDFVAQENKVCLFLLSPHLFTMKWWDQTFVFWRLSFKPVFLCSYFTFIKRLFSYSSLSAIRVVSSVYLRLLIFLPAILIPACTSSSPAFHIMFSTYKLNKQGDNTQPWCNQGHKSGNAMDIIWR